MSRTDTTKVGTRGADDAGKRQRLSVHQVGLYILVTAIVLFAVLNLEKVSVDVVFTSIRMSLVFVIAAMAFVGFGAGYLHARNRGTR